MCVFDLLTTNYPKENIWHNPDRDKYKCNKKSDITHNQVQRSLKKTH